MTTTNRAFIKAYRQDAAQPVAAATPPVVRAEQRQVVRASSHTAVTTATKKRPLSEFVGRAPAAPRSDAAGQADFFRPGTTVASFEWPAVCRLLWAQCGNQLNEVADRLLVQADQGRSLAGILGLFPGGGATTTALCLASALAARRERTILVDGDFRRPSLSAALKAVPTAGWDEMLKHAATLSDAVVQATDDQLALLALGERLPKDAIALVTGLQAAVTAGVLRHAYGLVLVDLGTFFDGTSQPIVLELVRNLGIDVALAVAGPEPADARDLATIAEKLADSGCELLGTIENRVPKPQAA